MQTYQNEYEARANVFLANPKAHDDSELWSIVRSINLHTELNCRVVSAAKTELRTRGFSVA